jgi:F0F1-type ATP synthase epsilon subunit
MIKKPNCSLPLESDAVEVDRSYACRVRVKLGAELNITGRDISFMIGSRQVQMQYVKDNSAFGSSSWLIFRTNGFDTETSATEFGTRLKRTIEMSAVTTRIGVDSGLDNAPGGISEYVRTQLLAEGLTYLNDIHGVGIFHNYKRINFVTATGTMSVLKPPEPFVRDIQEIFMKVGQESTRTREIILLLNYALTREDPVSKIVFAISAVEMLGQNERWSAAQTALLANLAKGAMTAQGDATDEERAELADAIGRMHKIGLRQGVMRFLKSIGLENLKKEWDSVYADRSTLVHGIAPQPGIDYHFLCERTINLCGSILLAAIEDDLGEVAVRAMMHYKILPPPPQPQFR